MNHAQQFYIDGHWVDPLSQTTLDVINPATATTIGTVALGNVKDVDRAVAAAVAAFGSFADTSRDERVGLLRRIEEVYSARAGELAQTVSAEMGAPITLARNAQIPAGAAHLDAAATALAKGAFEHRHGSTSIVYEPVGVCALITPWNWPLNQIVAKVAAALAAGCTVVLKPSEVAPLNAIIFAEILHDAGVPPGVFNLVNGDGHTVGRALSRHPDIDMVSFTGSTRAGVMVAADAATTVKRVTQELGGKSANIILDDADLEQTLARDLANVFANAGQSCNAGTRILVPAARMADAARFAAAACESFIVGDPSDPATQIGPVASQAQYEKVQALIQSGFDDGARVVAGGTGRPASLGDGYFVKPTVFADVSNDMRIAREEIFGPVVALIPYETVDQAVQIANDTDYGLSGYVSSADPERARAVARRLRTGMVHLNGAPLDMQAPFGGYKKSGNGREFGEHGLRDFLETKSIYGDRAAAG